MRYNLLRILKRVFVCLTADVVFISLICATLYTLFGIGGALLVDVPAVEGGGFLKRLLYIMLVPVVVYLVLIFLLVILNTLIWSNADLKGRIWGRIAVWSAALMYVYLVSYAALTDDANAGGEHVFLLLPIIYCISNILSEYVWERYDPRKRAP